MYVAWDRDIVLFEGNIKDESFIKTRAWDKEKNSSRIVRRREKILRAKRANENFVGRVKHAHE